MLTQLFENNEQMHIFYKCYAYNGQDILEMFRSIRTGSYSFIFESLSANPLLSRYSFFGIEPAEIIRVRDGKLYCDTCNEIGLLQGNENKQIIDELDNILKQYHSTQVLTPAIPYCLGGWVVIVAYDFLQYMEPLNLARQKRDIELDDLVLLRTDKMVVVDHYTQKLYVAKTVYNFKNELQEIEAYREIELFYLQLLCPVCPVDVQALARESRFQSDTSLEEYKYMVRKAKTYIAIGDVYQVNLAQRLSIDFCEDPLCLYALLRKKNPAPFSFFIECPDYALVSSSPERLIQKIGQQLYTRPIAGTSPRGNTEIDDIKLTAELLINEKERAEHIMLVDLERNDLGKVSKFGSVSVDELFVTEEYAKVIHIVSSISATQHTNISIMDIFRAIFPGGTITGTPKIRAIQIIDELECHSRGFYTGSAGFIGFNGDIDLNIIIRTILVTDNQAYIHVGAGIVAESVPENEYQETLYKAQALMETMIAYYEPVSVL